MTLLSSLTINLHRIVPGLFLVIAVLADARATDPPSLECDRLAAHPEDPRKAAAGLAWHLFDPEPAIPACEAALRAHPEVPRFQFQLARALHKAGRHGEAVPLYRRAAKRNYAAAQVNLGRLHAEGLGLPVDLEKAVAWYRKAAEQGHAGGQVHLGFMYARGRGVDQDQTMALTWYRRAAARNDAAGQTSLGRAYAYGRGVPQDYAQAAKWHRLAAEQGHPSAQNDLGALYALGLGVARDDREALGWYRAAADRGLATAQYNLGIWNHLGRFVPRNLVRAYMWYSLAADQKHKEAIQERDFLGKKMTPEQRAEARRLAARPAPGSALGAGEERQEPEPP